MEIKIIKNDITTAKVDAIVNAANEESENSENKEDDPTSAYKIEARKVSPNPAEIRTQENYKNTKRIMTDRLEKINGYLRLRFYFR